jgi:hypothetical protein
VLSPYTHAQSLSSTTARLLPQFNTWDLSVTLWALVSWEYNPGSAVGGGAHWQVETCIYYYFACKHCYLSVEVCESHTTRVYLLTQLGIHLPPMITAVAGSVSRQVQCGPAQRPAGAHRPHLVGPGCSGSQAHPAVDDEGVPPDDGPGMYVLLENGSGCRWQTDVLLAGLHAFIQWMLLSRKLELTLPVGDQPGVQGDASCLLSCAGVRL